MEQREVVVPLYRPSAHAFYNRCDKTDDFLFVRYKLVGIFSCHWCERFGRRVSHNTVDNGVDIQKHEVGKADLLQCSCCVLALLLLCCCYVFAMFGYVLLCFAMTAQSSGP